VQNVQLIGLKSSLELAVGAAPRKPDRAPLLCAAELGFCPLGGAGGGRSVGVSEFVNATRDRQDGMYLALAGPPLTGRRFLLVQDDRSTGVQPNYYQLKAPDRSTVWRSKDRVAWRDYYYAAVYVLLTEAADKWRPLRVVEFAHATGHGWPEGLAASMLDALGHACDTHSLGLDRVYVRLCCTDAEAIEAAVRQLEQIRAAGLQQEHRPINVKKVDAEALDMSAHDGLDVYQVCLPIPERAAEGALSTRAA
jgi:hypothetical protein